ncbi:type II toxin-antitoxin system VapB family antitoxin [Microcystis aeruginosa]
MGDRSQETGDYWLSYSLCDKFNLYSSVRSLCPLCLCGSFHSLARKTVS